ncbi:response regulator transcription factor [Sphingosinicella rhizophila]|uniref:Response regulator n=1 Tax=Sphingosinicella rhizophila TaxID=3050082 RepID=A0ABU3QBB1_9SPHN|nr:response regulator [Sphingosinicella sp. GR2756]MDT9600680.1 response regulator [Sphingosinicella sp. GR2756]
MTGPQRILVCDDDPLLVELVEFRLSSKGYAVDVARDGAETLARLSESRPDAVVLDAMMPIMDGYEVLRRMREQDALAEIPVIMLTARKQERDIVGALELGASDFMVKPFMPEELVARLARLLAESK